MGSCTSASVAASGSKFACVLRFEAQKFESAESAANAKAEQIRLFREGCPRAALTSTDPMIHMQLLAEGSRERERDRERETETETQRHRETERERERETE